MFKEKFFFEGTVLCNICFLIDAVLKLMSGHNKY